MTFIMETDRTPLCDGGITFQTLRLVEVSDRRIEFRPTTKMKVFCWVFMATGFGCLGLGAFVAPHSLLHMAVAIIAGLLFAGFGLVVLKVVGRPRILDKRVGWYWKGSDPRNSADVGRRCDAVQLERIHAVQILAKLVEFTGGESPMNTIETNYEINLVIDDGSRVNVHAGGGDGRAFASDADSVGKFLDVPVLDGRYSRMG
jgi:hypothetical protein